MTTGASLMLSPLTQLNLALKLTPPTPASQRITALDGFVDVCPFGSYLTKIETVIFFPKSPVPPCSAVGRKSP